MSDLWQLLSLQKVPAYTGICCCIQLELYLFVNILCC